MNRRYVAFLAVFFAACTEDATVIGPSDAIDEPTADFDIPPPDVDTDRPVDDCVDADGDSFGQDCINGADCNDDDALVNPGELEVTYDGVDNDCNASTRDDDLDRDGFVLADDCDDTKNSVKPGVAEVCGNEIDDDCDPETTETPGTMACPYDSAAADCAAALAADATLDGLDGYYELGGGTAWCDMTRDGGGWTLALVVSDDGVDTFTLDAAAAFSTEPAASGDLGGGDYIGWAWSDAAFADMLVAHDPSGVWGAWAEVSDGTGGAAAYLAGISAPEGAAPTCHDPSGEDFPPAGVAMTAGTLGVTTEASENPRALCSTDLYFNLGDLGTGTLADCEGGLGDRGYGPAWNVVTVADGACDAQAFDAPGQSGFGPSGAAPTEESDALGFGAALGLNTGTAGAGENALWVFVRGTAPVEPSPE